MLAPSVAIIGPGKIGRDLLIKLKRSSKVQVKALIGRNYGTSSEEFASSWQVPFFGDGLDECLEAFNNISIFIDATTAESHPLHLSKLSLYNPFVIDLTPSGIGTIYSPLACPNLPQRGISTSLVSCGGQTSLPMLSQLKCCFENIEYIEVVSSMASLAVGPGTRQNIDEYILTTETAIKRLVNVRKVKVILNINPATPPVAMKTTLSFIGSTQTSPAGIEQAARAVEKKVRKYCPGYSIQVPPVIMQDGRLVTMLRVEGAGDYLPAYAGNLDIINCACLELCERISSTYYS